MWASARQRAAARIAFKDQQSGRTGLEGGLDLGMGHKRLQPFLVAEDHSFRRQPGPSAGKIASDRRSKTLRLALASGLSTVRPGARSDSPVVSSVPGQVAQV